jgi:hypothetical protein
MVGFGGLKRPRSGTRDRMTDTYGLVLGDHLLDHAAEDLLSFQRVEGVG